MDIIDEFGYLEVEGEMVEVNEIEERTDVLGGSGDEEVEIVEDEQSVRLVLVEESVQKCEGVDQNGSTLTHQECLDCQHDEQVQTLFSLLSQQQSLDARKPVLGAMSQQLHQVLHLLLLHFIAFIRARVPRLLIVLDPIHQ